MSKISDKIISALNATFPDKTFEAVEKEVPIYTSSTKKFHDGLAINMDGRRIAYFYDLLDDGSSQWGTTCADKGYPQNPQEVAFLLGTAMRKNGLGAEYQKISDALKLPEPNQTEYMAAFDAASKHRDGLEALKARVAALMLVIDKPADMGWAKGKQRDDYIIVGTLHSALFHTPLPHGFQNRSPAGNPKFPDDYIAALPQIEERYKDSLKAGTPGRTIFVTELIADVLKRYDNN